MTLSCSLQGDSANEQPRRAEPQPAGGRSHRADRWAGGRGKRGGRRRCGGREEQQHREPQPGITEHHRDAQAAAGQAALHHQQVTHTCTHTCTHACTHLADWRCVFPSMSGFGVNRNPGFNMNNSMSNNIFNGTGRKHLRVPHVAAHARGRARACWRPCTCVVAAHLVGCVFQTAVRM